jgi:hypothetical protein
MQALAKACSHFHFDAVLRSMPQRPDTGLVYLFPVGSLSGVESSLPVRETLLLLLEVTLLDTDERLDNQMNCLSRMVNFLHSTLAAQGSAGTSTAAAGAAAAAADAVLQPVLQHLAPLMLAAAAQWHATSSSTASEAAPSSSDVSAGVAPAAQSDGTSSKSRSAAPPSSKLVEMTAAALADFTAAHSGDRVQNYARLLELLVVTGEGLP